jgi:hypothetical protein
LTAVVRMIGELEAGSRTMSPENLVVLERAALRH